MKFKYIASALIIFMACLSNSANAETACKSDYFRYCKGVTPGEGRIFNCLNKKLGQLSPKCRKGILGLQSCKADHQKYCKNVGLRNGAIVRCLEQNMSKLNPACSRFVKAVKAARAAR